MIKKEDLRIGNKVGLHNAVFDVTQLFNTECFVKHIEGGYGTHKYESLQPIPLTSEILEKYGFDVQEYEAHLIKNGLNFTFEFNGEDAGFYLESVGVDIKYLHQLQNLYFALTGKELTVNL